MVALLGGASIHAATTDIKKPLVAQPVSAAADTQASARRQGAVNVSGINWTCSGTHCSANMAPAMAAPVTMCQGLAREVGAIRNFTVANLALNSSELQQCNSQPLATTIGMPAMDTPPKTGIAFSAETRGTPLPSNPQPGKAAVTLSAGITAPTPPGADPAKKPSDAKSALPAIAPGGKATPPPPPAPVPAGGNAPPRTAAAFSPVAIRTLPLTLTGVGVAEIIYRFTPVAVRTAPLTLTGMGVAETSYRFIPVAIRTPALTLTGTGRSE
jgi:hypothetical protein